MIFGILNKEGSNFKKLLFIFLWAQKRWETEESETYGEYSSQYKKNNFLLNAGQY